MAPGLVVHLGHPHRLLALLLGRAGALPDPKVDPRGLLVAYVVLGRGSRNCPLHAVGPRSDQGRRVAFLLPPGVFWHHLSLAAPPGSLCGEELQMDYSYCDPRPPPEIHCKI
eukprot:7268722-Pyramimonas_sp.AAC.1